MRLILGRTTWLHMRMGQRSEKQNGAKTDWLVLKYVMSCVLGQTLLFWISNCLNSVLIHVFGVSPDFPVRHGAPLITIPFSFSTNQVDE